ncbi:MAG TPA: Crp/Fnr family transcriptional regulator [Chitinophaga sp.]
MLPPSLQHNFSLDAATRERYAALFHRMEAPARTLLLKEGQVSQKAFFVVKGCLRVWFNNQGRELTCQFFFEGESVSSIESFRKNTPSQYNIETIEPSELYWIHKTDFEKMQEEQRDNVGYMQQMMQVLFERQLHYMQLFFSFIRDTPTQRYQHLLDQHPEIIRRVPQHYIASYLGITPVSLSRIRHKLLRTAR